MTRSSAQQLNPTEGASPSKLVAVTCPLQVLGSHRIPPPTPLLQSVSAHQAFAWCDTLTPPHSRQEGGAEATKEGWCTIPDASVRFDLDTRPCASVLIWESVRLRPVYFWGASVCVRFAFMFALHDPLLKQLPATKSVVDWHDTPADGGADNRKCKHKGGYRPKEGAKGGGWDFLGKLF